MTTRTKTAKATQPCDAYAEIIGSGMGDKTVCSHCGWSKSYHSKNLQGYFVDGRFDPGFVAQR